MAKTAKMTCPQIREQLTGATLADLDAFDARMVEMLEEAQDEPTKNEFEAFQVVLAAKRQEIVTGVPNPAVETIAQKNARIADLEAELAGLKPQLAALGSPTERTAVEPDATPANIDGQATMPSSPTKKSMHPNADVDGPTGPPKVAKKAGKPKYARPKKS